MKGCESSWCTWRRKSPTSAGKELVLGGWDCCSVSFCSELAVWHLPAERTGSHHRLQTCPEWRLCESHMSIINYILHYLIWAVIHHWASREKRCNITSIRLSKVNAGKREILQNGTLAFLWASFPGTSSTSKYGSVSSEQGKHAAVSLFSSHSKSMASWHYWGSEDSEL